MFLDRILKRFRVQGFGFRKAPGDFVGLWNQWLDTLHMGISENRGP